MKHEAEIGRLRLDELLTEVLRHKVLHRVRHLVWTKASQNQDLLEQIQLVVPPAWQVLSENNDSDSVLLRHVCHSTTV